MISENREEKIARLESSAKADDLDRVTCACVTHVLTILRLFMSSSIGFFFGMTRLVRPRCNAPKILLNICKTSSDDLRKYDRKWH